MNLEDIAEIICRKMESLEESDKDELEKMILHLLENLQKVRSRFIDIDPSLKDDEVDLRRSTHLKLLSIYDQNKAEKLYGVYETLKSYLFMRGKHGEAADWFLKNELIS